MSESNTPRLPILSKNPEPEADTSESPCARPQAGDKGLGVSTDGGQTAREHEHRARTSAAALAEHARRAGIDPVDLLATEIVGELRRVNPEDGVWVCEDHGRRSICDAEAIICRTVERCVRSEAWDGQPCGHVVCAECRGVLRWVVR